MKINFEADPGDVFATMMMVDEDQTYPLLANIAFGWNNVYITNIRHKKGVTMNLWKR